jgi:hypothetical protein
MSPEAILYSMKSSEGGYLGPPRFDSNDSAVHFKDDESKSSEQVQSSAEVRRHGSKSVRDIWKLTFVAP